MNRIIHTLLISIFFVTAISAGAEATCEPDKQPGRPTGEKREQLAKVQARELAGKLGLDGDKSQQFQKVYLECQEEMWECRPPRHRGRRYSQMTEQECKQLLNERFENHAKILRIQQKYYKKYSKVLTQKQILKFYDLEKDMMDKMWRKHGKARTKRAKDQK